MKGLELCKRYFFEVGLPRIKVELPEIMPFLSAGLGGGSQCHGNDDEISRDHGWGPGFGVWLSGEIKERFDPRISNLLNELPKSYLGHSWASENEARFACPIMDIDNFFKVKVGVSDAPTKDTDWLKITEERLFEITHCQIFYDAPGELTKRIKAFQSYYSNDVWQNRLAKNLIELWRWGTQYVKRATRRGDVITAGLLWGRYAENAMKVGFLLNREYAPYEKWLYVQFKKLPEFGEEIGTLIRRGVEHPSEIEHVANQIEELYIKKLFALGFETIEVPDAAYPKQAIQLLEFAKGISKTITNPELQLFR